MHLMDAAYIVTHMSHVLWCVFVEHTSELSKTAEPIDMPPVCPIDRQQQQRLTGLLQGALRARDIDR